MSRRAEADPRETTIPASIEAALRRVRAVTAVLVAVRLLTTHALGPVVAGVLVAGFVSINAVSCIAQRQASRLRVTLGVVQLLVDMLVVLVVTYLLRTTAGSADWAVLVLPVMEGAIRFQVRGALASWSALALGYAGWTLGLDHTLSVSTVAQQLVVVLILALPSGVFAEHLASEIAAHRRGRREAERRGGLLRAAALSGRKSTRLDVDEILGVLRDTVGDMGFADPQVFELTGEAPLTLMARPVRQSKDVLAIPPGDERLIAADQARNAGTTTMLSGAGTEEPPRRGHTRTAARLAVSTLFAVPVATVETGTIVLTARWPGPGLPPASQAESLDLFAAQAGASLRNAQVFGELQELKDRLAHEASHDALTDLPNRRRFHEQLERMCGRGRVGDALGVLFLDLDGFKQVNDRFGHDTGNALLVAVAGRLRSCVRPGDIVARMGGDEFTILLTRLDNPAPAVEVADRICAELAEPFLLDAQSVRISTSIGIALAPADVADPGDLVRRADVAMYRAKSHGKAGWAMDPVSLQLLGAVPQSVSPAIPSDPIAPTAPVSPSDGLAPAGGG